MSIQAVPRFSAVRIVATTPKHPSDQTYQAALQHQTEQLDEIKKQHPEAVIWEAQDDTKRYFGTAIDNLDGSDAAVINAIKTLDTEALNHKTSINVFEGLLPIYGEFATQLFKNLLQKGKDATAPGKIKHFDFEA